MKALAERWYRKMARTEKVTVNEQEFELQSVSPSWYLKQSDNYGMSGSGRKDTPGYVNCMLRNVIIAPPEVAHKGLAYLDEREDLETVEQLIPVIERFLRTGRRPATSGASGTD